MPARQAVVLVDKVICHPDPKVALWIRLGIGATILINTRASIQISTSITAYSTVIAIIDNGLKAYWLDMQLQTFTVPGNRSDTTLQIPSCFQDQSSSLLPK